MTSTSSNHISDDWGWYIDLENEYHYISQPIKRKKPILSPIYEEENEDEYDYYMNNQKDVEMMMECSIVKKTENRFYSIFKNILNIIVILIASTFIIIISNISE